MCSAAADCHHLRAGYRKEFGSSAVNAQVLERQPSPPQWGQPLKERMREPGPPVSAHSFNFVLCHFFIKCPHSSLKSLGTENQTELLVQWHFHSCALGVSILCVWCKYLKQIAWICHFQTRKGKLPISTLLTDWMLLTECPPSYRKATVSAEGGRGWCLDTS